MPIDILFLGGTSVDLIQDKKKKGLVFFASVGGGITNSAIISARLGLKTALLSRIGKDPLGDLAVDFLKSCGVDADGVIQDPGIHTPIAIANIDKKGNSRYTFYKNTSLESIVSFKEVPGKLLNNCRILHFGSSFSYQKESSIEAIKYVKYLKGRGAFISFDPNVRPYAITDKASARNRILKLLRWVDLARISELDLEFLTAQKDPKKGLKKLKKLAGCEVVLTLGSKGALYLDKKGRPVKIPAFKVKIADTIGAGDAFTSGLLYKLIKYLPHTRRGKATPGVGKDRFFNDIAPHLSFAAAVSALVCAKKGAGQGLKDIRQVELFLARHEWKQDRKKIPCAIA